MLELACSEKTFSNNKERNKEAKISWSSLLGLRLALHGRTTFGERSQILATFIQIWSNWKISQRNNKTLTNGSRWTVERWDCSSTNWQNGKEHFQYRAVENRSCFTVFSLRSKKWVDRPAFGIQALQTLYTSRQDSRRSALPLFENGLVRKFVHHLSFKGSSRKLDSSFRIAVRISVSKLLSVA